MPAPVLGLRANWRQFSLLVAVNAFVGAMIGLERTVLPLLAREEFGIASATVTLSFIVAFGVVKALTNLAAGHLASRIGRRRLLIAGWVAAVPVPALVVWAPSWGWIVAANVLLGVNQGLAWSMTVIMKIDLVGPERRGLALGLNESAGYLAVAGAALATGALAAAHGPRPAPFLLGFGFAAAGLALSTAVRDTAPHVAAEGRSEPPVSLGAAMRTVSWRDRSLSAAAQAGLVNNLNDAMVWGLLPLYLAARGLPVGRIGVVAAAYPVSWGLGQLAAGALSDRTGRKPLIVGGMWLQAGAIGLMLVASGYGGWTTASLLMGLGTALVYPTLLAVVGDVASAGWRASAVGVYRLWRDLGYAAGAILAGSVADALGLRASIAVVGALTALSGMVVARRMVETLPRRTVRPPAAPAEPGDGATFMR